MQSHICSLLHTLAQPFYPSVSTLPVLLVLHAIRTSVSWHHLRSPQTGSRGSVLQDLFGYWVLAFGGSTLVAILLREPSAWLTSPTILILYTTLYLLLENVLPTAIRLFPPTALTTLLTVFDSLYRSFSLLSIHTNLTGRSDSPIGLNPLAGPILSAINVSGGRALVSLFRLSDSEWTLQTPSMFTNGHLDSWVRLADTWSAIAGISVLQWSAGPPNTSNLEGREDQAVCALTIAGCLAAVKYLSSKRDGRLLHSPLPASSPRGSSFKNVSEIAEPSSPSDSTTNTIPMSEPNFYLTSPLSSSSTGPSASPSLSKSASLASVSSASLITTPTTLSPPPVIHRDFFKPGKPLSEGRRKTIEIRNKELMRRADERGTGVSSRTRFGTTSWNNEPTLIKNRAFTSINSGKTKIKNSFDGK
ncbi:hypothetical protein [Phaffia rhodozyma]|uniref:Uncharacterized protein n=1 Tax=Phaffia rhodozyma TaxID=264483 RepID=A0A0F7SM19_PHARH|nr:hypothetical protein [Phaffia rhodozyma]